jgi:hypothetical protein
MILLLILLFICNVVTVVHLQFIIICMTHGLVLVLGSTP